MTHLHPYRRDHPHSRLLTLQAVFFLVFVVFLFLLSGFVTNASAGAVLLGFAPALSFGIILIFLVETDHFFPAYNWLVAAIILVIAAVVYFGISTPVVRGLDAGTLLALNAIIMTIALFVLHASYAHEEPVPEPHHHAERRRMEHIEQPQEISDVIRSIEDKIKALNFVIGRVYSVYHGGTDRLRNKLRIDKAWYDDFNQIDEKDIAKRRHEAIVLLEKIKHRLELLRHTEADVLGSDVQGLKNIQHKPDGSESVIDVLVRNDKDPVLQYYDGALQFCTDALKALQK